ncbi:MAG: hypothetical protein V1872_03415 [bacterium]
MPKKQQISPNQTGDILWKGIRHLSKINTIFTRKEDKNFAGESY